MPTYKYKTARMRQKAVTMQNNAYKKRAYKSYTFRFHKRNDADIIKKLDQQHNRTGYLKRLIRK